MKLWNRVSIMNLSLPKAKMICVDMYSSCHCQINWPACLLVRLWMRLGLTSHFNYLSATSITISPVLVIGTVSDISVNDDVWSAHNSYWHISEMLIWTTATYVILRHLTKRINPYVLDKYGQHMHQTSFQKWCIQKNCLVQGRYIKMSSTSQWWSAAQGVYISILRLIFILKRHWSTPWYIHIHIPLVGSITISLVMTLPTWTWVKIWVSHRIKSLYCDCFWRYGNISPPRYHIPFGLSASWVPSENIYPYPERKEYNWYIYI